MQITLANDNHDTDIFLRKKKSSIYKLRDLKIMIMTSNCISIGKNYLKLYLCII